tara:strand:+ start:906 stop:1067 length:162 start_codon:yes stop_codon:yes gene_type:complete
MQKTIVVIVDGEKEVAEGDSGLIETLADWASVNGYEHYIYETSRSTGEYTDER